MDSQWIKAAIIAMMWIGGAVGTFGMAIYGSAAMIGVESAWLLFMPLVLSLVGTILLWIMPERSRPLQAQQSAARHDATEKTKNQSPDQLGMLLSLMDEDEIAEFKERLKERVLVDAGHLSDGEMAYDASALEALLGEDDQQVLQG